MPRKQYDPKLKAEYGNGGEDAVIEHYRAKYGLDNVVLCPLGQFGPDLLVRTPHGEIFVEVERRKSWEASQTQFPFPTVNMPERKAKWLRLAKDQQRPLYYLAVRDDCRRGILFHPNALKDAQPFRHKNRLYHGDDEGESFVSIPAGRGLHLNLGGVS